MWPYETAKILKSLKTKIPKVINNLNIKFKKAKKFSVDSKSLRREFTLIAHFTVAGETEAGVDLVLIQPFLLYYVNHVFLMLTNIF